MQGAHWGLILRSLKKKKKEKEKEKEKKKEKEEEALNHVGRGK